MKTFIYGDYDIVSLTSFVTHESGSTLLTAKVGKFLPIMNCIAAECLLVKADTLGDAIDFFMFIWPYLKFTTPNRIFDITKVKEL